MGNLEIIDSVVSESCISLFQDYSLLLQQTPELPHDDSAKLLYCGVLGFSGDQMRGTLLLATSREPLGRTSPTSDSSFREWIAELANQLLGRIKNKLIPRGVTLHMSTPIVLRGEHLAPIPRDASIRPYTFSCDGGYVCVWFDAELTSGLDLSAVDANAEFISEGESMLF